MQINLKTVSLSEFGKCYFMLPCFFCVTIVLFLAEVEVEETGETGANDPIKVTVFMCSLCNIMYVPTCE